MLFHIVLFQPLETSTPQQWEAVRRAITELSSKIPGIRQVAWGPNVSPEQMEQGYTQGFVMIFEDRAALDAYLPHPEHVAVFPLLDAVSKRTLVYDLDVPE